MKRRIIKWISVILALCVLTSVGLAERAPWDCDNCGNTGLTNNFCGKCGNKAPETWQCSQCGCDGNLEFYCVNCGAKSPALEAVGVQIGDVITYGHYEQDADESNGTEPIEWIVLDYDANKDEALLISKYGLEAKQYHHETPYPTWEKSDVRAWLNGDFLNAAFTAEEQKGIQTVKISTPSLYGLSRGKDTRDKIWLLSRDEAEEYFMSDEARQTTPTKYAVTTGAYQSSSNEIDGTGCCDWWLRSPGDFSNGASHVLSEGVCYFSIIVSNTSGVVRPAFVLNLASAKIS